tara:strand:+ start:97454 stop:98128 length:675 start_codon:yes stop_codon:yes gene_type:complete
MIQLKPEIFKFLDDLKLNNNREWMNDNKNRYQRNEKILKSFYAEVKEGLNNFDAIDKTKVFRINRDIRFSNDKTPYNVHRSASYSREGDQRRGGYYLRIQSGNSRMAGGFFSPEPADLLRIRKEFEMDDSEIREILARPAFQKAFGGFNPGNQVKTAPRGFNVEHPANDLIKNKSFFVSHAFTDGEVLAADFQKKLIDHYKLLLPFFNYMSDVLTTDLNGESLL